MIPKVQKSKLILLVFALLVVPPSSSNPLENEKLVCFNCISIGFHLLNFILFKHQAELTERFDRMQSQMGAEIVII